MSIGESVLAGFLEHELRCLVELRGGRDAMQAGQVTQIFVRGGSAGLVSDCYPLSGGEEGFLRVGTDAGEREEAD